MPAHGTADAPVRIDPAVKLDAGAYGTLTGRLVGTGAHGVRVTVPFGAHLEVPSADLTVKGLDRHGDPAASPSAFQLFDDHRDTAMRYTLGYPDAGSTTIRVPLGTYALSALIMTRDEPGNIGSVASVSQLYRPEVTVSGDTAVTLDARAAERIAWDTERASRPSGFAIGLTYGLDGTGRLLAGYATSVPSYAKAIYAQPVRHAEKATFLASARQTAPLARFTSGGGRVLDPLPVQKATEFDGKGTAEVVAIGKGTDADFAAHDLTGKVALVDAGPGGGNAYTWDPAAAKAGAAGVLAAVPDSEGRFQITGPEGVFRRPPSPGTTRSSSRPRPRGRVRQRSAGPAPRPPGARTSTTWRSSRRRRSGPAPSGCATAGSPSPTPATTRSRPAVTPRTGPTYRSACPACPPCGRAAPHCRCAPRSSAPSSSRHRAARA